jgi:hypothetical protein
VSGHTPGDQLDLDAIEARASSATPGPWEARQNAPTMSGAVWNLRVAGEPGVKAMVTEYQHGSANADFIAHAREDVPALVAEVRRLRSFAAEVQGVRNMVERDANLDPEGDQWATGNRVACRGILKELDGALGMLERP